MGSVVSVVILILLSFTSVVGYNSVASDIKASPLFTIRTNRALDKYGDVTCEYIGMGEDLNLLIPNRNEKTVLFQMFIERISKMDDTTFDKFIAYLINYAHKNSRLNGENPDKIKESLHLLRNSDKSIPMFGSETKYELQYKTNGGYWSGCCFTLGTGIIGWINCLVIPFYLILFIILELIGLIG